MSGTIWKKRLEFFWRRIYLYPAPQALPITRWFWVALGVVCFAMLAFSCFFIAYLTNGHAAYRTNAEDLGIMDQAIWSTIHGQPLHETVCNILHDTNCAGPQGIMRFAIHFQPILFPISLLYFLWPSPDTLLILQTIIVALGAIPAFLLARLRLRYEWAAVAMALLYLLYPAQIAATTSDFHPETLVAGFLFFSLYFMYTRRTVWLFVFAFLAILCKEEISLLIAGLGLWSMLFQRRWRSGLALALLGIIWAILALEVIPALFSPTTHPLLSARYTGVGSSPAGILQTLLLHPLSDFKQYILEQKHLSYLKTVFIPAGFLPFLAPWVLILALPTLALNLLSSDPGMRDGLALSHYNAEIVPLLIFSTIEAIALILGIVRWISNRRAQGNVWQSEAAVKSARFTFPQLIRIGILALLSCYVVALVLHYDTPENTMPFAGGYNWSVPTPHNALARTFIDQIPPTASVSAQSDLVPHISHRSQIYLFPFGDGVQTPVYADYVFLDTTSDIYPFSIHQDYQTELGKLWQSGNYGILEQQDGYYLLKRGLSPPHTLPVS